jgi:hypothetical protein
MIGRGGLLGNLAISRVGPMADAVQQCTVEIRATREALIAAMDGGPRPGSEVVARALHRFSAAIEDAIRELTITNHNILKLAQSQNIMALGTQAQSEVTRLASVVESLAKELGNARKAFAR